MAVVSIIVPVFNVEQYLERCLNSLISQTLKNIEIILVDDGSTDYGGRICDVYAERDNRIQVIHKTNEGLSCARNDGIIISHAPYIMFVDGDDWVKPDFCEKPYKEAIKNNADLVLFLCQRLFNDGRADLVDSNMQSGLLDEIDAIKYNLYVTPASWVGLYHRKLFENISFPVGKYYEEISTTYKLIHVANRIWLINDFLYEHTIGRPGSITTDPRTINHPDKRVARLERIMDLYEWGFSEVINKEALDMLIMYGSRWKGADYLVDFFNKKRYLQTGGSHHIVLLA